jgi:hypothetical protein
MDDEMKSKPMFKMQPENATSDEVFTPDVEETVVFTERDLGPWGDLTLELCERFVAESKSLDTYTYKESACTMVIDEGYEIVLVHYVQELDVLIGVLKRVRKSWKQRNALRKVSG